MVSYRRLFEALDRARIEYLIAGGFAVNLHQVQCATVDLDLIVQLTTGNLEAFVELMTTLGYRPRLPVDSRDFAKQEIRESWIREKNMTVFSFFNPSNPLEHVDVFVREPKPFGRLKENRFEVKAFGLVLPVLGLDDLIELKKTAGRDKDLFDVSQLEKKRMETEGRPPDLTPEQIISWLDECRQFMFEVWNSNPHLKEEWDRINQKQGI